MSVIITARKITGVIKTKTCLENKRLRFSLFPSLENMAPTNTPRSHTIIVVFE
jgi:hypothetical protein